MVLVITYFFLTGDARGASLADKIDVSGTWELKVDFTDGSATPTIVLTQQGEKITGTYTGRMGKTSLEGSLKGKSIKFAVTLKFRSETIMVTYTGAVEGESMKGTVQVSSGGSGNWSARRTKQP
jgi:hypothetical protein